MKNMNVCLFMLCVTCCISIAKCLFAYFSIHIQIYTWASVALHVFYNQPSFFMYHVVDGFMFMSQCDRMDRWDRSMECGTVGQCVGIPCVPIGTVG